MYVGTNMGEGAEYMSGSKTYVHPEPGEQQQMRSFQCVTSRNGLYLLLMTMTLVALSPSFGFEEIVIIVNRRNQY